MNPGGPRSHYAGPVESGESTLHRLRDPGPSGPRGRKCTSIFRLTGGATWNSKVTDRPAHPPIQSSPSRSKNFDSTLSPQVPSNPTKSDTFADSSLQQVRPRGDVRRKIPDHKETEFIFALLSTSCKNRLVRSPPRHEKLDVERASRPARSAFPPAFSVQKGRLHEYPHSRNKPTPSP